MGLPPWEFHEWPHLRQVTRRLGSFHFTDRQRGHLFGRPSFLGVHSQEHLAHVSVTLAGLAESMSGSGFMPI